MKRLGKHLSSKADFALFSSLIALTLGYNSVKDLSVTKIVKEIKSKGVWGELESKYLRPGLVFT